MDAATQQACQLAAGGIAACAMDLGSVHVVSHIKELLELSELDALTTQLGMAMDQMVGPNIMAEHKQLALLQLNDTAMAMLREQGEHACRWPGEGELSDHMLSGAVEPMLIGLFRQAVQLALASGETDLIKPVEASILDLLNPANTDQVSSCQPMARGRLYKCMLCRRVCSNPQLCPCFQEIYYQCSMTYHW